MFDESVKNRLLQRIPQNEVVCGAAAGDETIAVTISWIMQAAEQPPSVVIAIRRASDAARLIRTSKVFSINFVDAADSSLSDALRDEATARERLQARRHHAGVTGSPVLDDAAGAIECTVIQIIEHGDHDLFVGDIIATEELRK